MTNDEILSLIKEAFEFAAPEEAAALDSFTMDSSFAEFGISSIVALEMAGYIEEKLGIQFADDELAQIGTIKGLINLICQQQKALV